MSATARPKPQRLIALDVFRGATIFLMILVNTAGAGAAAYPMLVHAKWFGFTLADLVFPSFLFAMGNAMAFSLGKPVATGPYLARLARRCAIIFLLGYLMYWFPFVTHGDAGWALKPFDQTRVPGVLQRIALCYFLAGLMARWLSPRQIILASLALLLGYWAVLLECSAPGMAYDKYANAGTRFDLWLLGQGHLYKKDAGFDPEGLLATLPATVNVLAGYLVGIKIARGRDRLPRIVTAMALVGAGLVAAAFMWAPYFPIAKKLWTGPYVLLTTGIDLLLLGSAVTVIEIARLRRGTRFFTLMGRNPLAIYLFSELFVVLLNMVPVSRGVGIYDWIGIHVFQAIAPGPFGSLLCAFAYTMLCWSVGWWMDRRGIFLRA